MVCGVGARVCVCVVLVGVDVMAQCMFAPTPLSERLRAGELVVEAQVMGDFTSWMDSTSGHIYTSVPLRVFRLFKGSVEDSIIVLRVEGGVVGNRAEVNTAEARLQPGMAGVFILAKAGEGQWRLPSFAYSVVKYSDGEAVDLFARYGEATKFYRLVEELLGNSSRLITFPPEDIYARVGTSGHLRAITGVSPDTVCAGCNNVLTITGSGFGNSRCATCYVMFPNPDDGGATYININDSRYYLEWIDTRIRVIVPDEAIANGRGTYSAGSGTVRVRYSGGTFIAPKASFVKWGVHQAAYDPNDIDTIEYRNMSGNGGYIFIPSSSFKSSIAWVPFKNALEQWVCATLAPLDTPTSAPFTTTTNVDNGDGQNVLAWGNIDNAGGVLGYLRSYYRACSWSATQPWDWYVNEMDMRIDNSENWYVGPGSPSPTQMDLYSVILHELGHAIQLAHVNQSSDLMYYALAPGQTKRTLNSFNIEAGSYEVNNSVNAVNPCFSKASYHSACIFPLVAFDLRGFVSETGEVWLEWGWESGLPVERFEVYRRGCPVGEWALVDVVAPLQRSYTDESLVQGWDCMAYRVKAILNGGEGVWSPEVVVLGGGSAVGVSVYSMGGDIVAEVSERVPFSFGVRLYDVSGRLLAVEELGGGTSRVRFSGLQGGWYIVNVGREGRWAAVFVR